MVDEKTKRWIAVKTDINTLFNSKFIEDDSDLPSYILTETQEKIYRVNLMVIVLNLNTTGNITNVLVDDGSGKISLRFFEDDKILNKIKVGNSLLVIGRLRVYNNEKYLSPEIVKLIDPIWLKVRVLELKNNRIIINSKIDTNKKINSDSNVNIEETNNDKDNYKVEILKENIKGKSEDFVKEKEVKEIIDEGVDSENNNEYEELLPSEKVIKLIKDLDHGNGVLIEEVIEKSKIVEAEKIIEIMIKNGEIFQNMPGKIKIL